jgi:hypothetical protein
MINVEPAKDFLKSDTFSNAIAWAKGYAKALGRDQLTPLLLAGGVLQLLSAGQIGLTDEDRQRIPDLEKAWQDLSSALQQATIKPIDDEKMALSDSLRRIVATGPKSLSDLISALSLSLVAPAVPASPILSAIVTHATEIAKIRNADRISADIFAAGAYIACLAGKLDTVPGLAAYLIANRDACEALLRGVNSDRLPTPTTSISHLPLADDIQDAIKAQNPEADRLRNAINLGLKIGVQLAAELAVAYHETGHAIVSAILRPSLTVTKITIVPNPAIGADGVTYYDEKSVYWERSQTLEAFQANMCVALAGRAAQLIKFGSTQIDAGASSDIETATSTAWRGIAELGLDPELGPVNLSGLYKAANATSGWLFDLAQRRTQETLKNAADRAENILRANWPTVEQTVSELMQRKTMNDQEFLSARSLRTIASHLGVQRALSKPVRRLIEFARSPGVLDTAEGPVRYQTGDGIVTGLNGERWPVRREFARKNYTSLEGNEFGVDGIYGKASHVVNALQISETTRIDLLGSYGILTGTSGDWIIEYGEGDLAIVGKEQFEKLYELPSEASAPSDGQGVSSADQSI